MALECPEVLEEGVFSYEPGKGWVRGLPSLREAPLLLVFVNLICRPGCERVLSMISRVLGSAVEKGKVRVGLVVCTRFRYVCFDDKARSLFTRFNIIASPSVAVLEGGEENAKVLKGNMRIEAELPRLLEELLGRSRGERREAKALSL